MSGGHTVDVDCSHHPLVVTTVRAALVRADLEHIHDVFTDLFARRAPFAVITDVRRLPLFPPADIRRAICAWNREHEAEIRRWNVASATALDSAFARAALRSIHWIVPHPTPYAYTATMEEAMDFTCRHLTEVGMDVPESLRRAVLTPSYAQLRAI